jgi:hypothetical protein
MIVKNKNGSDALTISLDRATCMMHFKHRLPTTDEIITPRQYSFTQRDSTWNLSSFFDQGEHNFHQQVIDTESYIVSSTNLRGTITVEINQNKSNLFFYDPS